MAMKPMNAPEKEQFLSAEKLKREGNDSLKAKNYTAAIAQYVSALQITKSHQVPHTRTTAWHELQFDILSNRLQAVLFNEDFTGQEHVEMIRMVTIGSISEAIDPQKQIKALYRCAKYFMHLGDIEKALSCLRLPVILYSSSEEVKDLKYKILGMGMGELRGLGVVDGTRPIHTFSSPKFRMRTPMTKLSSHMTIKMPRLRLRSRNPLIEFTLSGFWVAAAVALTYFKTVTNANMPYELEID
jgi:tetratricopeptide (TPR) repeat protein